MKSTYALILTSNDRYFQHLQDNAYFVTLRGAARYLSSVCVWLYVIIIETITDYYLF